MTPQGEDFSSTQEYVEWPRDGGANTMQFGYYGIFDGHGGQQAANTSKVLQPCDARQPLQISVAPTLALSPRPPLTPHPSPVPLAPRPSPFSLALALALALTLTLTLGPTARAAANGPRRARRAVRPGGRGQGRRH